MIEFRLNVDVLGNTRFAYSPLVEVAESLMLLGQATMGHLHEPWVHMVRDVLDDVDLPLLTAVAPPGRWLPDFFALPATTPHAGIETQLDQLLEVTPECLAQDLEQVWEGRSMPAPARELLEAGPGGLSRLSDAIWTYWQVAIQPHWSRMCAVLEDDVAYRAGRSLTGGLFDLLADLHPEVSVHDDSLLIDKPHHDDYTCEGAQLTLVPSVFVWPLLVVAPQGGGGFELMYGARGVGRVWEGLPREPAPGDPVSSLLGRTRATILTRLTVPRSTTQLARELGQSPGTVSTHLAVLRDCGLVTSWRSGRSVLYRQTPLAASILNLGRPLTGSA